MFLSRPHSTDSRQLLRLPLAELDKLAAVLANSVLTQPVSTTTNLKIAGYPNFQDLAERLRVGHSSAAE